ncbi:hypothetical protein E4A48_02640 [Xanthomonas cerealis pv. cerealis]|uniref:Tetratricopeptide repeat protein n=1 Tax=Xanthomonas cerealis pv. cerealis TaxID=152263 RepID=A0A514E9U6_9XANT|nr:hypothetical protein [Xanthomonas translucens]QDI02742.1 hypothetical protein E4A48_02640 [Xanthomonas translucens pv. cerealis]UKE70526.1 hypothetical protein K8O61_05680 [Xanthomonas translucens pv. pistacia]
MTRYAPTVAIATLSLLLASCASAPPPPPPSPPVDTTMPAQRLAAIDASGGADDTELSVQPLRDPQVEDLRDSAKRKRAAGDLAGAAAALDQALQLVPQDPALLQDRAELALLLKDDAGAEAFAKRAIDLGSQTGPLCRRHWATIEQSRLARGQKENAASAHAHIEGCTVAGIKRY